jgi:polar amino acid transport system substrate-binding protein
MGFAVEIRLGAWSDMRKDLHDGRIDVLEGMSYSDERALKFDFTPPHTIVHHSIFVRKGALSSPTLADLRDKEVVVLKSGIMQEYLLSQGVGARIITAETHADVLRLLASGKHDYAVMAKLPGIYLIRELALANLEAVGNPVSAQNYCFAVRKGDAALLARFSEGLAILKNSGEYQKIYNKWLGVLEPPGISWREAFKYGAIILVPLVILIGGMALWSRTLQREVAMRTAELTGEVAERRHAEEELRSRQQQLVQADMHHGGVLSMEAFIRAIGERPSIAMPEQGTDPDGNPFSSLDRLPGFTEAIDMLIGEAVRRAEGNQSIAARLLGVSQPTLSKRLKHLRAQFQP